MKLKKYVPKKLFYRFLLIIILPVFIIQSISTYLFYQTHLQNVIKRISQGTIQNILFINKNFKANVNYDGINLKIYFEKGAKIRAKNIIKNTDRYVFFDQKQFFIESLLNKIVEPMAVKERNDDFVLSIQKPDGILNIVINKKELIVKTARIFIMWNMFLSFITLSIAIIFMRNQLKPIKLLKKHVKNFSLNQRISNLKPTGAKEIRDLSISFIEMEKRLKKFVDQRTIVLAGISHDLRTPLTRMKLELEMMDTPSKQYLAEDIEYMENIINQYLNFTKNINSESKVLTNVYDYLNVFIREYKKINRNIKLKTRNIDKDEIISIQILAFKRVLQNILDNAFKFGTKALITLSKIDRHKILISIEDNGCGVSSNDIEKLSEPFFKGDKSRNMDKGGVGLGLAISKDIVLANNGSITFNRSKRLHGLSVQITLNLFY